MNKDPNYPYGVTNRLPAVTTKARRPRKKALDYVRQTPGAFVLSKADKKRIAGLPKSQRVTFLRALRKGYEAKAADVMAAQKGLRGVEPAVVAVDEAEGMEGPAPGDSEAT